MDWRSGDDNAVKGRGVGKGWRRVGKAQLTCRIAVEVETEAREWTVLECDRRTELVERGAKEEGRPISSGGGRTSLVIMCSESFQGRMMVRDSFPSK